MADGTKYYFYTILGACIASLIPILVRFGEGIGSSNLSFFRVFLTALFVGLFFIFSKKKLVPPKKEKSKMLIFGALHGFIILGYFIGISLLPIALAVILFFMFPIWIALFSYIILKERITKRVGIALLISFIGLMFVVIPDSKFFSGDFLGIISAFLAGIFAGLVYVMSKMFKTYDKFSLVFWQNSIATFFLLPLLLINFPVLNYVEGGIVILIGIATAIPFILYYTALGKVNSGNVGVLMFLEGIIPIILAVFIFQEIPSSLTILGGVLIFYGSYLTMTDRG